MLLVGLLVQSVFLITSVDASLHFDKTDEVEAKTPELQGTARLQIQKAQPLPKLQPVLDEYSAQHSEYYGIYVKNIKTGETATHNADTTAIAASLYKLIASFLVLQQVDQATMNLDQPVLGSQSLRHCLDLAIRVSDNPCGRALRDLVNNNQPIPAIEKTGLKATHLAGSFPTTTARDIGVLLENIHTSKGLQPASSALLVDAMQRQQFRTRIPSGLPTGVLVANKTGDLNGYAHDAAIVTKGETTYVMVVLSGPTANTAQQDLLIADLSRKIYESVE